MAMMTSDPAGNKETPGIKNRERVMHSMHELDTLAPGLFPTLQGLALPAHL